MTSRFYRRTRFSYGLLITAVLILAAAPARAQSQRNDQEYTAKIREFTTETFFATPLVDHLPASETVPTPLDVLGHIAGAADVLSTRRTSIGISGPWPKHRPGLRCSASGGPRRVGR